MNITMRDHDTVILSREQAIQIMAISVMLKDDEMAFRGDEDHNAEKALCDIGEEIALQVAGYPG